MSEYNARYDYESLNTQIRPLVKYHREMAKSMMKEYKRCGVGDTHIKKHFFIGLLELDKMYGKLKNDDPPRGYFKVHKDHLSNLTSSDDIETIGMYGSWSLIQSFLSKREDVLPWIVAGAVANDRYDIVKQLIKRASSNFLSKIKVIQSGKMYDTLIKCKFRKESKCVSYDTKRIIDTAALNGGNLNLILRPKFIKSLNPTVEILTSPHVPDFVKILINEEHEIRDLLDWIAGDPHLSRLFDN